MLTRAPGSIALDDAAIQAVLTRSAHTLAGAYADVLRACALTHGVVFLSVPEFVRGPLDGVLRRPPVTSDPRHPNQLSVCVGSRITFDDQGHTVMGASSCSIPPSSHVRPHPPRTGRLMTRRLPLAPRGRAHPCACGSRCFLRSFLALVSTQWPHRSSLPVQLASWALAVALATWTVTRWLSGAAGPCTSDRQLRDLFEGVPIGLYRSTPEGQILDANRNLVDLLGYPGRGSLLATAATRLYVDPADRERWKAIVHQSGEVRAFEARMRRHSGGVIWGTSQSVRAILNAEGRIEYEGAVEDITERTCAERALRVSEERYGAAFEQAAIGLAEVSPAGRFLRANRYLCDRLGYTPAELLQKTIIDVTHPEDVTATHTFLSEAPKGHGPYRREKRYLKKDGTPIWSQMTTSLVRTADGGPAFFISVIEDLSDRKRLEAQLLHAQKLEAVGPLAGGVAHDFSNLIGAIQGYAQLVERTLAPEDPRRADIGEIRKAGQRAASLIHQLLTFARRQETQPQLVDVNGLLSNLGRLVTRVLGSNIKVSWGLPDDLPAIKVDPGQFEQVILNLAINARDAMPDGGTLGIEASLVQVDQSHVSRQRGSRIGPHVMITVSDTGMGMPFKRCWTGFSSRSPPKAPTAGPASVWPSVTAS